MKIFRHVCEAVPVWTWSSPANQMHTCNYNHVPRPHIGMYSKNLYFQSNNCSQVTIRLGFSVTVPKTRLLSRPNFVPNFVSAFFYFLILCRLPDNILNPLTPNDL
jgi:hypothetical protein